MCITLFNFHSPTGQTYRLSPEPGECQLVLFSCDKIDRHIHRPYTRYQCEVYHGFVDILTIGESRVVRLPSAQPAFLSRSEPPSARSTCTDCPHLRRYLPYNPYMLISFEQTSSTEPFFAVGVGMKIFLVWSPCNKLFSTLSIMGSKIRVSGFES